MDMESMLDAAALLFGLAALGGLLMVFQRFGQNRNPPIWLAMVHGFAAAAGLTLLAYAAWATGIPPLAQVALGLFVVAALGGAVINLRDHWKHVLLSKTWVVGHLVLAVVGFALLLRVAWG
jgi:hypothetical protein